jgi:hypothetical protein
VVMKLGSGSGSGQIFGDFRYLDMSMGHGVCFLCLLFETFFSETYL